MHVWFIGLHTFCFIDKVILSSCNMSNYSTANCDAHGVISEPAHDVISEPGATVYGTSNIRLKSCDAWSMLGKRAEF